MEIGKFKPIVLHIVENGIPNSIYYLSSTKNKDHNIITYDAIYKHMKKSKEGSKRLGGLPVERALVSFIGI